MRLLTRKQSQLLDQVMKKKLQLSEDLLIEAVASQCALVVAAFLKKKNRGKELSFLCGPGNNGKDGLVMARHLKAMGFEPVLYSDRKDHRLEALGVSVNPLSEFLTASPSVVVDALFGVGLNRALKSPFYELVEKVNKEASFVFSVDVPSGLDVDRGVSLGTAVRANVTLSIGALKPGFFTAEGPLQTGKLRLIPAGFELGLLSDPETHSLITPRILKSWIPKRSRRSHKGSTGKCHVMAGSKKFLGAGKLAALGALSSGATFVMAYGSEEAKHLIADLPEVIFQGDPKRLLEEIKPHDSVILGPGVEPGEKLTVLIKGLLEKKHLKVILDAGALEVLKKEKLQAAPSWILTPHPGEMARLLELTVDQIENDRFQAVDQAQKNFGGRFLLKGFLPLLKVDEDHWWCLPFGDDRLGKAGSGDILSGLIGGLMAQTEDTSRACALAVYLSARAALFQTKGRNRHSLLASELPQAIGHQLKTLAQSRGE